ncbi:MAG: DUF72 domain-containing protein [Aquificae bacterium]|nr:DUF72 domain-containing protein [Aquificota bacterium]
MKAYIGTCGYFYWDWKGKFYPNELKPHQWFSFYAKHFDTLEINSTFYKFPTPSSLTAWYKKAPKDFIFSLKVNKTITHIKRFKDTKEELNRFYMLSAKYLKEKLGIFLFQLPPSFRYSPQNLELIVNQIDPTFKNCIEFRHESWFREETFSMLKTKNIIFCCISTPKFGDICKNTANMVYVRLHGKTQWYKYRYTTDELVQWADKIKSINPTEAFIYFNNTYNAYAVENALLMKKIINQV